MKEPGSIVPIFFKTDLWLSNTVKQKLLGKFI